MKLHPIICAVALCIYSFQSVGAITLDIGNDDSIKKAASTVAFNMMKYYSGNESGQTPGLLPGPYYWWEAGAMWGAMVDYWYYTGDKTYNNVVEQALLFQVGENQDYKPRNATSSLGNDDQCFWAMAVMTAAETNFQNPPSNQPQWLALAQAVFNTQAAVWDPDHTCGGGLKWQIFPFNNGYYYKNSITNGCFFNLGARLAAYTGNKTYSDWAIKTWDWENRVGLMDNYNVYDGSNEANNCTPVADKTQWTYNNGIFMMGAAVMYNQTNSTLWANRLQGLVNASAQFFDDKGIMFEVCEESGLCKVDQYSFKAYLSRWMAATSKLAPFVYDQLTARLQTSAAAAAAQCSGGTDGVTCGTKWGNVSGKIGFDGNIGVGQQMSALEVIQGLLIKKAVSLVTNSTGGTSVGNPSAGGETTKTVDDINRTPVSTGDKAGAGVLTAIVLLTFLVMWYWMVRPDKAVEDISEKGKDVVRTAPPMVASAVGERKSGPQNINKTLRRSRLSFAT